MSNSLQGHLLVASPSLKDPNFLRSVVLIVQHSDEGALGLVLNRATNTTIKKVWEQIQDSKCQLNSPLYLGGPVEGPLVAIHTRPAWADLEVMSGLYYSVQTEHLEKLITAEDAQPVRFIAGYAGWGPGQLESEIGEGAWAIAEATLDAVFEQDAQDWEKISRSLADQQLAALLKVKHVPVDPTLN